MIANVNGNNVKGENHSVNCPPSTLNPKGIKFSQVNKRLMIWQDTPTSILKITNENGKWQPNAPQYQIGLQDSCQIRASSGHRSGPSSGYNPSSFSYKSEATWRSLDPRGSEIVIHPGMRFGGVVWIRKLSPKDSNFPGQSIFILEWKDGATSQIIIVPPTIPQTIPGTFEKRS
jgi:hypothetical protein